MASLDGKFELQGSGEFLSGFYLEGVVPCVSCPPRQVCRGGKSRAGLYSHTVDGWLDRPTMASVYP